MLNFGDTLFHPLQNASKHALPEAFTFPFYYEPHPLSIEAAETLQAYLESQTDFKHNFGLDATMGGSPVGKMFGVMVVKDIKGDLGFLAAFSGKLTDSNDINGFVPAIYNTLNEVGFYKKGEAKLNEMNATIEAFENASELQKAIAQLNEDKEIYQGELQTLKSEIKVKKQQRKQQREKAKEIVPAQEYEKLVEELKHESISYQLRLKRLKLYWEAKIQEDKDVLNVLKQPIRELKQKRSELSASLQKRIHEQYKFLNAKIETKDLLAIFKKTKASVPPAGSGECAAPKLFQYAYRNNLTPICMAEFWWGLSPKSEVRKHKHYYPSCRSKCEPILGHMMEGLPVDENPIEKAVKFDGFLDVIYEDDHLLVVNKPHEFLSVPGKTLKESVLTRMQCYLPNATGPLLVHRLDMSTSGLLLVAKNEHVHKQLQRQFIERTIQKRYVALLDGRIKANKGSISLPLRVDLDNRPQQLVCYDYGKPAKTMYEVLAVENGKTRVYFYPLTGRTHQLRVHAAHVDGLEAPIVGDDLYGVKGDRLHLHAELLRFTHPITKKTLNIQSKAPF
ncbi:RluA family pseudouridine synthase [Snuella sedimenti]|uniref:RNA pseudouridine synthase n=1 Tax=Snuella sedimenti TaxID=2798802 RepID=A0A8J7II69_9FLAO|nr:RluA family pseudouridine synthase [Snuella sedimenti]MBJ6368761.1 RNA pseudouridine synthase [Snuella sedimenti]